MPILEGSNSDNPRLEASKVVYDTNLFNGGSSPDTNTLSVDMNIPFEDEASRCDAASLDGQCSFTFEGRGNLQNTVVIGYPRGMLGSMGGRYCTTGFDCGRLSDASGANVGIGGFRDAGRSSASPVFDLNITQAEIGLPNTLNNIDEMLLSASAYHCAGEKPNVNYFVDAYLYDTTQNPPLPRYSGTINGINAKSNRMWNTNIWFGHPNQAAMWAARQAGNLQLENDLIRAYTGGQVLTEIDLGGHRYKLVIKHEEAGGNNFFYLGFVWVEQDDGTIPDPADWDLEYTLILDYIKSAAFWSAIQGSNYAQGIIADMASNEVPLIIERPTDALYLDGVAIGNEWFGQPTGAQGTICWDEMQWRYNGATYGAKAGVGCRLPVAVTGNALAGGLCSLPLSVVGQFDCQLPAVVSGNNRPVADCVTCPQYDSIPKLLVPYGSQIVNVGPRILFDIPEDARMRVFGIQMVSGNLSGSLVSGDPFDDVFYTAPSDGCDTECGKISVGYTYQCVDGEAITCCSEVMICSFPDVSNALGDETIFALPGEEIFVPVSLPVDLTQDICPPLKQPPAGSLRWVGNGWRFIPPEAGFIGTFDIVVPSYANGDKAHQNLRCVTICIQGPTVYENTPGCQSMLFIKRKSRAGEQFEPAVKIASMALQIAPIGSGEFTDYESCEKQILSLDERLEWTATLSGAYVCGDRGLYAGRQVEIMFVKDVLDPDSPKFYGTAKAEGLQTTFAYSNKDDDQTYSLTLTGTGSFYAVGWAI